MTPHAAPATSSADPQLLTLDIEDLTANPLNIRAELHVEASMVESVRAHGILQPLVVTETDDHSYLLVAGHRRLNAAIRAGLSYVPAIMRPDLVDVVDQVATFLGENDDRRGLGIVEKATGYQLMIDEGMTPAAIAKRVGRKTKDVKATLPAATATTEQKDLLTAGKATLEDLAALEEFKGDPATYKQLEAEFGKHMFSWYLTQARDRRRDAAAAAVIAAELEAAGVTIITGQELAEQEHSDIDAGHPGETWTMLADRPDDAADDEVRAEVEIIGGDPQVTWYRRTDPTTHPDDPEAEHERTIQLAQAAQKQQRDDLATAAHLRAVHLHGQILDAKTTDGERTLRDLIREATPATHHAFHRNAALLGIISEDETGKPISEKEYAKRRDLQLRLMSLPQLAQALYLIGTELSDRRLRDPRSWQADGGESWSAERALAWRAELADRWAYIPAPVEQQIIDADHAAHEPQDAAGDANEQ